MNAVNPPVFDNATTRTFLALAILFLVLSTLFVGLRLISKKLTGQEFKLEDLLITLALPFYYAQVGLHFWGLLSGGLGQPERNATAQDAVILSKQLVALQFPYAFLLCFTRVSIALVLRRIFVQRWLGRCLLFSMFLSVAWLLFLIIDAFAICIPFDANWDPTVPGAHCGNKDGSYIANAAWGIVNDAILLILPQFVVWNLKMNTKQKVGLSVVFALGTFDIAVSITRIVKLTALNNANFTYSLAQVEIWSYIESGVAIIVANVPLCVPVFRALMPHQLKVWMGTGSGRSTGKPSKYMQPDKYELRGTTGGHVALPDTDVEASSNQDDKDSPVLQDFAQALRSHGIKHNGVLKKLGLTADTATITDSMAFMAREQSGH